MRLVGARKRPVDPAPRLAIDRRQGVTITEQTVQLGLTKKKIYHVHKRIRRLIEWVYERRLQMF